MIKHVKLLRYIGQFDTCAPPADATFDRLAVIYAENGRGKTTLSAVLRSLATGDPVPIAERRRLTAQNEPQVVIRCDGTPQVAVFQDGSWSRTLPNTAIFDDVFVHRNVCSGLSVNPNHRQNLHEVILGDEGVALSDRLQELVDCIEAHNAALRSKAQDIPEADRHGLSVDDFCDLEQLPNVDDQILTATRRLAAAQAQDLIRDTLPFDAIAVPTIDADRMDRLLKRDLPSLDASTLARLQAHLSRVGEGAEAWIAEGMARLSSADSEGLEGACPFCGLDLAQSPIIELYRAYFGDAYRDLKQGIADAIQSLDTTHSGDVVAAFERSVRVIGERHLFWSRFCEIPDATMDTAALAADWHEARRAVQVALLAKQAAPLERMGLSESARAAAGRLNAHSRTVAGLSRQLQTANAAIRSVKEQVPTSDVDVIATDLARLEATKARFSPEDAALCDSYVLERGAKEVTARGRDEARTALDQYRMSAFPECEGGTNRYLERFNAGFRLAQVCAANTRTGPSCTYGLVIDNHSVPVAGGEPPIGAPSFGNTLSSGDRNALALAFFFASLDPEPDKPNPGLADKIVVIDDPISSLDDHRSLTTVQEIRRLSGRAQQVIVLSHNKGFLCRIWEGADKTCRAALHVVRGGSGSSVQSWDVNADSETEQDRRHALMWRYLEGESVDLRQVAQEIRPLLEAYLRVACPHHFPAGQLLGPFRGLCQQRVGTPGEILHEQAARELGEIVEYANRFHHDTNPAWETATVNDTELRGWVKRALEFASP